MMNGRTALLRVGQMAEADRLTVAAGTPTIDMMEHAGWRGGTRDRAAVEAAARHRSVRTG